jgi:hypothetical protein
MTNPSEAETVYRFAPSSVGDTNLAQDERIALLAVCVASQQSAGFRDYIDLREAACPNCEAVGFNAGWGYWAFVCGAEILSDGEPCKPCGPSCAISALEPSR